MRYLFSNGYRWMLSSEVEEKTTFVGHSTNISSVLGDSLSFKNKKIIRRMFSEDQPTHIYMHNYHFLNHYIAKLSKKCDCSFVYHVHEPFVQKKEAHGGFHRYWLYLCACALSIFKESLKKANVVSNTLRLNSEFRFMDATNLKFSNERFDKVLCIEVLEHVPDDNRTLVEIARVLKPQGILVLSVPVKSMSNEKEQAVFARPRPLERVRSGYEYESLKGIVERTGLRILKVEYWYRWFTKQALKVTHFLYHRTQFKLLVAIYPLLIPLGWLDKIHERVRRERGFYGNHIILAKNQTISDKIKIIHIGRCY